MSFPYCAPPVGRHSSSSSMAQQTPRARAGAAAGPAFSAEIADEHVNLANGRYWLCSRSLCITGMIAAAGDEGR